MVPGGNVINKGAATSTKKSLVTGVAEDELPPKHRDAGRADHDAQERYHLRNIPRKFYGDNGDTSDSEED